MGFDLQVSSAKHNLIISETFLISLTVDMTCTQSLQKCPIWNNSGRIIKV